MKGIEKEENEIKESKKKNNEKKIENTDNKKEEIGIYKKDNSTEKKEKQKENLKEKNDNETKKISIELEKLIEYKYNEEGVLINKKTGKKCGILNKQEYDLVGLYVQKYVENLIIKTFDLDILYVPNKENKNFEKRDNTMAQCKILTTKNFPSNEKCLILIQGTGVVRLGQWARSVCINENLTLGTMIPYVDKALKNKYSVIIMNPNERKDFKSEEKIEQFSTMQEHCVYVYNKIIKKNNNIKQIYIVAHSMGGECTVKILLNNKEDLINRKIIKIAFTDSVHGTEYKDLGKEGIKIFRQISRNYICSDKPAGTFVRNYETSYGGVDCYSSGHKKHEYTSGTAIDEIFKYFNE